MTPNGCFVLHFVKQQQKLVATLERVASIESGYQERDHCNTSVVPGSAIDVLQWSLSQQRPPSLMWHQGFFAATIRKHLLLPLAKGHLSNVATISWQVGWPY